MNTGSIRNPVGYAQEGPLLDSPPQLIVKAEPTVELLLAVAMLAAPAQSPGHYGWLDHPITQEARHWFTPYSDHAAVATTRRLFYVDSAPGFACDALMGFALRRGEPPRLLTRYPPSRSTLARADGDNKILDSFADQLRDFYHTSRFAAFWKKHAPAYGAVEEQVAATIGAGWAGEDVVATMQAYFGRERRGYVVVPTPMERPQGGTLDMVGDDATFACFECTVSKEWILHLLYHEVGHSFVNPLAERFGAEVQRYEGLYAPMKDAMRPWGYNTWTVALNELVLRAQNCRLRRQLLGDAAAEARLGEEENQGFRHIRALERKLAEYEGQRDRYPSLADFYPTLLKALDPYL